MNQKRLNLLFWGNSGNYPFQLAKMLIEKKHNVEMFFMKSDNQWKNNSQNFDFDNLPDWITNYDNTSYFNKIRIKKNILNYINNNFDVVIVCGVALSNAYLFKIPYVIFPTGGEINSTPFFTARSFINIKIFIIQFFYNLSIYKAKKIISAADGWHFDVNAFARFKHNGIVNCYAPIDRSYLKSLINKELLSSLNKKYEKYDLVIFWSNRINTESNSPSFKDPQVFLDAVFSILRKLDNIKIIYVRHGQNISDFEKQINNSKYKEKFDAVEYLRKGEYQTYLSINNILAVDSMAPQGGFSSNLLRDSLALSTLLAANYDDDILFIYPESYPVLKANSKIDLENIFLSVYKWSEVERKNYKKKIQNWFDKYMDHSVIINHYEREFKFLALLHRYNKKSPFPLSLIGKNKIKN